MRVFVTGATGHIGSALVPELLGAGHQVTAYVRSDASADAAQRLGADVRRGDLADGDGLAAAAGEADGVVHLAFRHDAMRSGDFAGAVASDLAAVRALGGALEGTGKPMVGVSGTLLMAGLGRPGTEEDTKPSGPRIDAENYTIGLADRGVRSSVVRFSPITHSAELDRTGFAHTLIGIARRTGRSAYVGEGANRWSSTHTRDTARLLRLALEQAPAGSRLHAAAEEGVPTKAIATAIGEHLGVPVVSITPQEADDQLSFLAGPFQLDAPTSSALTRGLLGWEPVGTDLLTDLADERYYQE